MIVVVAPYSPASRTSAPHLGAARKIESVVRLMARFGEPIVFVNSAHLSKQSASVNVTPSEIGGISLLEITPATSASRPIGKLLNVIFAGHVRDEVLKLGKPSMVWLYNGYAFESRLGAMLQRATNAPVILEMEDWHYSRSRGMSPKPLLDWAFWRALMSRVSVAFAVNNSLAARLRKWRVQVGLLPGFVSKEVLSLCSTNVPFSSSDELVTVGYFGGLTAEKGADWVVRLVRDAPLNTRFIVTGSGPLAGELQRLALELPDRLEFCGVVDDSMLVRKMGQCDVILNPHRPIASMANGVFPFKVMEAVASGRLVVSTALPGEGLDDALQGVALVGETYEDMLQAVTSAQQIFERTKERIALGAVAAEAQFSEDAIVDVIRVARCGGRSL